MSALSVTVPLSSSAPCQSYQRGVFNIYAVLVEIQRAHCHSNQKSLPFGIATALLIVREAFEQYKTIAVDAGLAYRLSFAWRAAA